EQIENKRENLDILRQQIDAYRSEIKNHGKALSVQIRSAYAMGKEEKLKLILNMEDPSLSSRMFVYYSYLNRRRMQKLTEITGTVKKLEELGRQRQQETERLESDLEKKKLEQTSLDKLRYERNQLLVHRAKDFSSHEQQLNDLLENEKKLNDLVHTLEKNKENAVADIPPDYSLTPFKEDAIEQSEPSLDSEYKIEKGLPAFSDLKGSLPWPVTGRTTAGKGTMNVEALMDGVLINAGEGTDIHAVTAGKVVYSEWLRGYGLLIIIDHGKGFMTLYAFNQSLYKRTGEWVKAGETIASVGQSGGRSRPGLYFGIRKNGKPVNPLEWCRKSNRNQLG
ncbi:MAG: murein hydrolase activator EnvC family protein, partial [Gammaproteobacteria bacterium]